MESFNLQKLIRWGWHCRCGNHCCLSLVWPFYSVPTGSRGVITRFGAIVGIEAEGLTILPPWEKLSIFSIRAETANVQSAEGATSDTQPVTTSLTCPLCNPARQGVGGVLSNIHMMATCHPMSIPPPMRSSSR